MYGDELKTQAKSKKKTSLIEKHQHFYKLDTDFVASI